MAINSWNNKVSCGDETAECDKLSEVVNGKAPLVEGIDNCAKALTSEQYPGVMVATSSSRTELRSGSKKQPIRLPLIDVSHSASVPSLAFQNSAGDIKIWKPAKVCYQRRVVMDESESFRLVEDLNPNVFDNACIGTIDDVDYVAGAVLFNNCAGEQRVKLVFFPVSELSTSS